VTRDRNESSRYAGSPGGVFVALGIAPRPGETEVSVLQVVGIPFPAPFLVLFEPGDRAFLLSVPRVIAKRRCGRPRTRPGQLAPLEQTLPLKFFLKAASHIRTIFVEDGRFPDRCIHRLVDTFL
jgi:hypothetical protein